MANSSTLVSVEGNADGEYNDSVTQKYLVHYDSVQTNFYSALVAAQSASGSPVPARRTLYSGTSSVFLYARRINGRPTSEKPLTSWEWTVEFMPPPEGERDGGGSPYQYTNPLDRPAIYNVEYFEREKVLEQARNVLALDHGDGKGGSRAADTLGPIVNAAGKRPDEPVMETERLEVLIVRKNYASLADIVTKNRTYKRSTNSDAIFGYTARQLRYLLTTSEGVQFENGISYWPGVTQILAEETTSLILDNVGYEYWDAAASAYKRAVDKDGDAMSEPISLKADGDKGGDNTTTLLYRYLTEKVYASLFT